MQKKPSRHPGEKEIRCKGCGILLAKIDKSGLTIRRGELQATINGDFLASIVCYRPRCRTLNVLSLKTESDKRGTA